MTIEKLIPAAVAACVAAALGITVYATTVAAEARIAAACDKLGGFYVATRVYDCGRAPKSAKGERS